MADQHTTATCSASMIRSNLLQRLDLPLPSPGKGKIYLYHRCAKVNLLPLPPLPVKAAKAKVAKVIWWRWQRKVKVEKPCVPQPRPTFSAPTPWISLNPCLFHQPERDSECSSSWGQWMWQWWMLEGSWQEAARTWHWLPRDSKRICKAMKTAKQVPLPGPFGRANDAFTQKNEQICNEIQGNARHVFRCKKRLIKGWWAKLWPLTLQAHRVWCIAP